MAWGIGPGDAVFVPDFTFFSTGEVVSHCGAEPVFVDVELDTFNISPASLRKMIEKVIADKDLKPRAVIAVDLFGLPSGYRAIREITDKYELLLLEDGAQGFGGSIGGKRACSFGDISTTSFFPMKPLGCYGDGGAVFTDDSEWAEAIKSIKVHGKGKDKYDNIRIGVNSRLDTLQAAILLQKFKSFNGHELEMINSAAKKMTEGLKNHVTTPEIPAGYCSSWAQYTIRLRDRAERDGLNRHLAQRGIPTAIYYSKAMHCQGAYKDISYRFDGDYPNTTELTGTVLSLPIHPYLYDEEIELIIECIKEYWG
jgi:dTDP-4-amino-4,6-dideoxygalactose transaminase